MTHAFRLPPQLTNQDGEVRGVGFEFEVGNLGVEAVARALVERLGGTLSTNSSFEAVIEGSAVGKLKVERDTHLLTSLAYRRWLENLGMDFSPGSEGERWERSVDKFSRQLIPCEIVTDPIPVTELDSLHDVLAVIEAMHGQGTQHSFYYAFGLHINPAAPSLESASLIAYLQSFLLLSDWIIEDAGTDFARRFFTKYIDPFPKAYGELILNPEYRRTLNGFMDDYLEHNPTRNRSLDMLPIFYYLDPDRVLACIKDSEKPLMKGRPAYHYRLPDCRVGEDGWTLEEEWNRWQLVEMLAADSPRRVGLMEDWQQEQSRFRLSHRGAWVERVEDFVREQQRKSERLGH